MLEKIKNKVKQKNNHPNDDWIEIKNSLEELDYYQLIDSLD